MIMKSKTLLPAYRYWKNPANTHRFGKTQRGITLIHTSGSNTMNEASMSW